MIDDKTAAAELVTRAVAEAINAQEPAVRERMMAAWLAGRRAFRKVGPHRFVVLIDGEVLTEIETPIGFIPWPDALPEDRTN